jgi:hypothetical protein
MFQASRFKLKLYNFGGSFLSDAAGSTDNRKQKKTPPSASLRLTHVYTHVYAADFFQEISSFRKQTDIRSALSNVLRERGLLESAHVLPPLTDSDAGAILAGACRLFSDELAASEKDGGEDEVA